MEAKGKDIQRTGRRIWKAVKWSEQEGAGVGEEGWRRSRRYISGEIGRDRSGRQKKKDRTGKMITLHRSFHHLFFAGLFSYSFSFFREILFYLF